MTVVGGDLSTEFGIWGFWDVCTPSLVAMYADFEHAYNAMAQRICAPNGGGARQGVDQISSA